VLTGLYQRFVEHTGAPAGSRSRAV
jgi:hypothetical protein